MTVNVEDCHKKVKSFSQKTAPRRAVSSCCANRRMNCKSHPRVQRARCLNRARVDRLAGRRHCEMHLSFALVSNWEVRTALRLTGENHAFTAIKQHIWKLAPERSCKLGTVDATACCQARAKCCAAGCVSAIPTTLIRLLWITARSLCGTPLKRRVKKNCIFFLRGA